MMHNTPHTPYRRLPAFILLTLIVTVSACGRQEAATPSHTVHDEDVRMDQAAQLDTATFGAGCFWCVEAVFQQLEGVKSVVSGYAGGHVPNPTYAQVCSGTTGHAEVCRIVFDPKAVSYADLLQAFFMSHDPTTLNRQGNDAGTQYRSVILYHTDEQRALAEKYLSELDRSGTFSDPIVTEIAPFTVFYKAEEYHQNYYNENGSQPYCQYVIRPKLDKFTKQFKEKLKKQP
jgi:peptide-methionine (S)-S-oxide reductase